MQGKKKKKKRGCQSINFSDIKHLSKQARRDDRVNRIERAGKKLQSANGCSLFWKTIWGEKKRKEQLDMQEDGKNWKEAQETRPSFR